MERVVIEWGVIGEGGDRVGRVVIEWRVSGDGVGS